VAGRIAIHTALRKSDIASAAARNVALTVYRAGRFWKGWTHPECIGGLL
jgi:hypothetical protein